MKLSKASGGVLAIAGAAVVHLTGAAPSAAQNGAASVFFAPSKSSAASPAASSEDRQVITVIADGVTTTITIVDGEIESASHNGKDVPTNRVRVHKDRYEILDKDGEVAATITRLEAPAPPAAPRAVRAVRGTALSGANQEAQGQGRTRYRVQSGPPVAPAPPAPPAPAAADARSFFIGGEAPQPAPKVMIGVNLTEPDAALRGHFGLKPGESTMFSGVYQGLPAASAGIGVYDIVVKVNGNAPAGPEQIRSVLRELNPGDDVRFTVLQRGQQKDVRVKVEAYSSERLSQARVDAANAANVIADAFAGPIEWRTGQAGQQLNEEMIRRYMAEAAAGGLEVDRLLGRVAPAPGQTIDPSVVPLIRLDEMRQREIEARNQAMDAATRAEQVARMLTERAAQMEKRQVELNERSAGSASLEKRLDRLERMLEKLLEEQEKDRRP